ncbi:MAG TPA: glycosyltransferase family 39 protein, partial [Anaerolineae bacterium]|nr:glycosyltransferase family 39 protein [Anaerolineae bacterium]
MARVLWMGWLPVDPIEPIDAEGFHLLAVNVLAGRGFAIGWEPPFCPTAVRTPLYPLFLMGSYLLLGAQPAHAVLLQVLLEALTTALVIRLGRDLGGRRAGALAGLLYALNGTTQRYTGYLLSEMLLLPLIAAALLLTARALHRPTPSRVASSALFWGLALLTKPNIQFLVIAVGLLVTARQVGEKARKRIGGSADRRIGGSADRRIRESANQRISKSANQQIGKSPCHLVTLSPPLPLSPSPPPP